MVQTIARFKTAFLFAFDIEKAEKSREIKSGFRPAKVHKETGLHLFGDLRLRGAAALLKAGFAENLVIAGRVEPRYPGENISQPWAIREMLIHDHGIDPARVEWFPSKPGTAENVVVFKWVMQERGLTPEDCVAVSNFYHIPRLQWDMADSGLLIRCAPAEMFVFLEDGADGREEKSRLLFDFGVSSLTDRVVAEIMGLPQKVRGSYKATSV